VLDAQAHTAITFITLQEAGISPDTAASSSTNAETPQITVSDGMVHIGIAAAPQRTPQRPELVPDVVSYTSPHAI
jgi:hypothetical protein